MTAPTPRAILIAARALIDTPEKWTQDKLARNESGWFVPPKSPEAVCFCGEGAIIRAACDLRNPYGAPAALLQLCRAVKKELFYEYNDHPRRKRSQIMAAFDKAIAAAGEP